MLLWVELYAVCLPSVCENISKVEVCYALTSKSPTTVSAPGPIQFKDKSVFENTICWKQSIYHLGSTYAKHLCPWLGKSSSQVEFCSTKKFIIHQSNVSKTSCKDLPAVTDERPSPCSVFSLFYKVHFASYFTQ